LESEDTENNLLKLILKEDIFLENAEKLYKLFASESYTKNYVDKK
jgi:hypothetical protein